MSKYCVLIAVALVALLAAVAAPPAGGGQQGTGEKHRPGPPIPSWGSTISVTVEGTVKALDTTPGPRGMRMLTITIATAKGTEKVLAPQARLDTLKLKLAVGAKVKVTAMQFSSKGEKRIVASQITVAGKTYNLLTSLIDGMAKTTVTGTVKKVYLPPTLPAAKLKPGEGKDNNRLKDMVIVWVILETANGPAVVNLVPQPRLEKLGWKPAKGQKLTVAGWKRDVPPLPTGPKAAKRKDTAKGEDAPRPNTIVIARTVTLNGKTLTLRDDQGKLIGQAQGGKK